MGRASLWMGGQFERTDWYHGGRCKGCYSYHVVRRYSSLWSHSSRHRYQWFDRHRFCGRFSKGKVSCRRNLYSNFEYPLIYSFFNFMQTKKYSRFQHDVFRWQESHLARGTWQWPCIGIAISIRSRRLVSRRWHDNQSYRPQLPYVHEALAASVHHRFPDAVLRPKTIVSTLIDPANSISSANWLFSLGFYVACATFKVASHRAWKCCNSLPLANGTSVRSDSLMFSTNWPHAIDSCKCQCRWLYALASNGEPSNEQILFSSFSFNMDTSGIDDVEYLKRSILGGRQYCLKEPLTTLPKARRQLKL